MEMSFCFLLCCFSINDCHLWTITGNNGFSLTTAANIEWYADIRELPIYLENSLFCDPCSSWMYKQTYTKKQRKKSKQNQGTKSIKIQKGSNSLLRLTSNGTQKKQTGSWKDVREGFVCLQYTVTHSGGSRGPVNCFCFETWLMSVWRSLEQRSGSGEQMMGA